MHFITSPEEHKENIVDETHPVYDKVAGVANNILKANKDLRQIYDKVAWKLWLVPKIMYIPILDSWILPFSHVKIDENSFHGLS